MTEADAPRERWSSRLGFVLASAGAAIGLGSIWKFPYITGMNGGGLFVLVYLACIALIAIPIMIAEIMIGRAARAGPVGTFRALAGARSPWTGLGWLGVASAAIILSYYSVVAGWTLHYAWLAARGALRAIDPAGAEASFAAMHASPAANLAWHAVFMAMTVGVVIGGVQRGIEKWSRVLMPLLLLMMVALTARAMSLDGFAEAFRFVFGLHAQDLTARGVLEALGHSFFTLSIGLCAMVTYGSYLGRDDDVVSTSVTISLLDTLISLMACLMIFPIVFSAGLEPAGGPGLIFRTLPVALAQLPGAAFWSAIFFLLLAVAALGSTISLLEIVVAHLVDERGWPRRRAALAAGLAIAAAGVPSALSGASRLFGGATVAATEALFGAGQGRNWFDTLDWLASNVLLPLGGLGLAVFVAWRVGGEARRQAFCTGSRFGRLYGLWLWLLRWLVPAGVAAIFLHALGAF